MVVIIFVLSGHRHQVALSIVNDHWTSRATGLLIDSVQNQQQQYELNLILWVNRLKYTKNFEQYKYQIAITI